MQKIIKEGIVIPIEEIIECLRKQLEEEDSNSSKENLAIVEKEKQDLIDKHGVAIPIATVYKMAKQCEKYAKQFGCKHLQNTYGRIITIINTWTCGYYEGKKSKEGINIGKLKST